MAKYDCVFEVRVLVECATAAYVGRAVGEGVPIHLVLISGPQTGTEVTVNDVTAAKARTKDRTFWMVEGATEVNGRPVKAVLHFTVGSGNGFLMA